MQLGSDTAQKQRASMQVVDVVQFSGVSPGAVLGCILGCALTFAFMKGLWGTFDLTIEFFQGMWKTILGLPAVEAEPAGLPPPPPSPRTSPPAETVDTTATKATTEAGTGHDRRAPAPQASVLAAATGIAGLHVDTRLHGDPANRGGGPTLHSAPARRMRSITGSTGSSFPPRVGSEDSHAPTGVAGEAAEGGEGGGGHPLQVRRPPLHLLEGSLFLLRHLAAVRSLITNAAAAAALREEPDASTPTSATRRGPRDAQGRPLPAPAADAARAVHAAFHTLPGNVLAELALSHALRVNAPLVGQGGVGEGIGPFHPPLPITTHLLPSLPGLKRVPEQDHGRSQLARGGTQFRVDEGVFLTPPCNLSKPRPAPAPASARAREGGDARPLSIPVPTFVHVSPSAHSIAGCPQSWLTLLSRTFGLEMPQRQGGRHAVDITGRVSLMRVGFAVYCKQAWLEHPSAAAGVRPMQSSCSETTARLAFYLLTCTFPPRCMWLDDRADLPSPRAAFGHLLRVIKTRLNTSVSFCRVALPMSSEDMAGVFSKGQAAPSTAILRRLGSRPQLQFGPAEGSQTEPVARFDDDEAMLPSNLCFLLVKPGVNDPEAAAAAGGRVALIVSCGGVSNVVVRWLQPTVAALQTALKHITRVDLDLSLYHATVHSHVFGEAVTDLQVEALATSHAVAIRAAALSAPPKAAPTPRRGFFAWLRGSSSQPAEKLPVSELEGARANDALHDPSRQFRPPWRSPEPTPAYTLGMPLQEAGQQAGQAFHPHNARTASANAVEEPPGKAQGALPLLSLLQYHCGLPRHAARQHILEPASLVPPLQQRQQGASVEEVGSGQGLAGCTNVSCVGGTLAWLSDPLYASEALTVSTSLGKSGMEHLSLTATTHLAYIMLVQFTRGVLNPTSEVMQAFPSQVAVLHTRLAIALDSGRLAPPDICNLLRAQPVAGVVGRAPPKGSPGREDNPRGLSAAALAEPSLPELLDLTTRAHSRLQQELEGGTHVGGSDSDAASVQQLAGAEPGTATTPVLAAADPAETLLVT